MMLLRRVVLWPFYLILLFSLRHTSTTHNFCKAFVCVLSTFHNFVLSFVSIELVHCLWRSRFSQIPQKTSDRKHWGITKAGILHPRCPSCCPANNVKALMGWRRNRRMWTNSLPRSVHGYNIETCTGESPDRGDNSGETAGSFLTRLTYTSCMLPVLAQW